MTTNWFDVLDSGDPVRGSMSKLSRVKAELAQAGNSALDVHQALTEIAASGLVGLWEGAGADTWLSLLDEGLGDLQRLGASYRGASSSLHVYVLHLQHRQPEAAAVLGRFSSAARRHALASAELRALSPEADASVRSEILGRMATAMSIMRSATTAAEDLRDQHMLSQQALARDLDDALEVGVKPLNVFQRLVAGVAEFLEEYGWILVLVVVAVVSLGVAAYVGGVVFAAGGGAVMTSWAAAGTFSVVGVHTLVVADRVVLWVEVGFSTLAYLVGASQESPAEIFGETAWNLLTGKLAGKLFGGKVNVALTQELVRFSLDEGINRAGRHVYDQVEDPAPVSSPVRSLAPARWLTVPALP